jgi:DNA replication protein DnaC
MDTANPQPSHTADWTKDSSYEVKSDDDLLLLMVLMLQRRNIWRPTMTPDEVRKAYVADRDQRDAARAAFASKCDAAAKAKAEETDRDRAEARQRKLDEGRRNANKLRDVLAERRFRDSGAPALHMDHLAEIDGTNTAWLAAHGMLREKMRKGDGFLYALLGKRGRGKTQLAVSLVRLVCNGAGIDTTRQPARYVKALEMFGLIRSTYGAKATMTEAALMEQFRAYDLLVIDECHQRAGSDFEQNTLVSLLDRRYDAKKCTLLIANQSPDEFSESIGSSVVSRMYETGGCLCCDTWPEYRMKKGA